MDKSKNSEQKMNLNHENNNNQMFGNKLQNEKDEINEIIIELKISDVEKEKEINILCDKNQLIEDNKKYKDYYKKIILIYQKNLIILIKKILNYT